MGNTGRLFVDLAIVVSQIGMILNSQVQEVIKSLSVDFEKYMKEKNSR